MIACPDRQWDRAWADEKLGRNRAAEQLMKAGISCNQTILRIDKADRFPNCRPKSGGECVRRSGWVLKTPSSFGQDPQAGDLGGADVGIQRGDHCSGGSVVDTDERQGEPVGEAACDQRNLPRATCDDDARKTRTTCQTDSKVKSKTVHGKGFAAEHHNTACHEFGDLMNSGSDHHCSHRAVETVLTCEDFVLVDQIQGQQLLQRDRCCRQHARTAGVGADSITGPITVTWRRAAGTGT
ncbi:hypothetical protein MFTT_57230 [Mycolicibacterium fortuitum subsp. fortuitum]|nr:hypothetical protein MFTT_57230 [Mycolicibacterium fortuitum subsp. fortuitum]